MFKNAQIVGDGSKVTAIEMGALSEGSIHSVVASNSGSATEVIFHLNGVELAQAVDVGGSALGFKANLIQSSLLEVTVPSGVTLSISYIEQVVGDNDAASIAVTSAEAALSSEQNASDSETAAAESAAAALASEQHASDSETAAGESAAAALDSVQNALNSETAAAASAAAALDSEQNAAGSAAAALTSEQNAAASAEAALTSEQNAATSEQNASDSAAAAEQAAQDAAGNVFALMPDGTVNDSVVSQTSTWSSEKIAQELEQAGEVEEAPVDGKQYARKNADWVEVEPTNLSLGSRTTTAVPVNSSTGSNVTLPAATTTLAGVMTSADKTKLDGIAAGAQVNVATNLGYTASTRVLTSSTGSNVTLPQVTTSADGLMTSADKSKLNSHGTNATGSRTVSTGNPSGGANGDIWLKY